MNICIIPARGGSQRIKHKNIKKFHGKPIIQYSMALAEESGLFSDIVVSTDDKEIASFAHDMGVRVHSRPETMARDEVGTQEVARDVLIHEKNIGYREYKYACVLYATSPLLGVSELIHGYKLKKEYSGFAFCHSVDRYGVDAGTFYWGEPNEFIFNTPLYDNSIRLTVQYPCDINDMEDWKEAEKIFEEINHVKKYG